MISAGDLRKGTKILYKNEPHAVVDFQHTKPGKGPAYIKTKMKNLITGLLIEATFRSAEKIPAPDLAYHDMQYLYCQDDQYHFLNQNSYEQEIFSKKQVEDIKDFLKEEVVFIGLYFNEKPIAMTPPIFVELKVVETQAGVRGDTAQGGATKPATMETGLVLQVPLFVNADDIIKVDTRDGGKYIERVSK